MGPRVPPSLPPDAPQWMHEHRRAHIEEVKAETEAALDRMLTIIGVVIVVGLVVVAVLAAAGWL